MSENARVVLVASQGAGNVGSVARLASNFEVRDLCVVSPQCDWLGPEAQKFACHLSLPLLRGARKVEHFSEAISDCHAVIGFSRRPGDLRQQKVTLEEIAGFMCEGRVALVYGREDNGLSREELLACTHVCAIASSDACPSMNLSHSVAVVLAQLFELLAEKEEVGEEEPVHRSLELATAEEFELFIEEFRKSCISVGLDRAGNPERMMPYVRRLFQRSRLSRREMGVLRLFLSRVLNSKM